jgi:predicted dehydrogenase
MDQLIVVGCGEHYRNNLAPSLVTMEAAQEVEVVATVDLRPFDEPLLNHRVPHVVRQPAQSLADCLKDLRDQNPIVLLAHSHDWHASDASDLVAKGFRVVLEKPYAIKPSELSSIRELVQSKPNQIVLAEYYLMMKAAPLLHAAGLLNPKSFYTDEHGYLQDAAGRKFEDTRGVLQSIGRPRLVFADILEGEGATGHFEHRGQQFADSRMGIGVILDLALHVLAPLYALEGFLGQIPPASDVAVGTAVCETFVQFAKTKYRVPPQFVPETYAELAFTTSTGVAVVICVGKYVPANANQRRVVIVGDEGEALLDLSSCTLSLARSEQCPQPLLSSPKRPESKYRAVLRACFLGLSGASPYTFSSSEVAIRSNDLALRLYSRASEGAAARKRYSAGVPPGSILKTHVTPPVSGAANHDLAKESEGAKVYYEHQYDRMTSLEDQGFKMSGAVFLLTGAVFTFLARTDPSASVLPWQLVIWVMLFSNLLAIAYVWRVNNSINIHGRRAKDLLKKIWPDLAAFDEGYKQRFADKIRARPMIQTLLHVVLVAAAVWVLWIPKSPPAAASRGLFIQMAPVDTTGLLIQMAPVDTTIGAGESVQMRILRTNVATSGWQWTVSDSKIASVSSAGLVRGQKSGAFDVRLCATDAPRICAVAYIHVR